MFSISALSLSSVVPIAYLVLVLGSLAIFSSVYRRRKALQSSNLEPWFPNHHQRDVYLTLLHLENPPCPPKLLKAALFERAREDIIRLRNLRERKPAANQLLQKGSISESTWRQLNAAEAELNMELQDVTSEARALGGDEWGQTILAQANEYHQKIQFLKIMESKKKFGEEERKKWDKELQERKEAQDRQREIALKELSAEEGVKAPGVTNGNLTNGEGDLPNGNGTNSKSPKPKKKNKK